MKRLLILVIMTLVMTNNMNANIKTDFFENIIKMRKGKVGDVVSKISKVSISKGTKEALSKNFRIPKLTKAVKEIPKKAILVNKAEKIMKKGDFESKFFMGQKFDNQMAIIVQSSKYGDEYFTIAKKVSDISPSIIAHNQTLVKYIPVNKLNTRRLQGKYIETLEKTSTVGWKRLNNIVRWVAKHPKISTASGAYVWYVLDPVGFEEQVKNSGKTLTLFLMDTFGSIAGGAGTAVTEKIDDFKDNIKEDIGNYMDEKVENFKISNSYIATRAFGILILMLFFIAWRKRKFIYHFLTKADEAKNTQKRKYYEKDEDEF